MKKLIITLSISIITLFGLSAQAPTKYSSGKEELSFDGNDLVSYFESNSPQKGLAQYTYQYDDLNLRFASQENLEKFKANPDKYIPEYNGWCAIALTHGNYIRPDFNQYKVQDGKLLFFEVRAFFNGKTAWEKDPEINKVVADKKWGELSEN